MLKKFEAVLRTLRTWRSVFLYTWLGVAACQSTQYFGVASLIQHTCYKPEMQALSLRP